MRLLLVGRVTLEGEMITGSGVRRTVAAVLAMAVVCLGMAPAGAQTVRVCDGLTATIVGTPDDDMLTGTPGPDVIAALQGDDVIWGLGGDDVICGGFGSDTVVGGEGFDIIFGAQGNDVIYAANGPEDAERQDTRGARMFGGAGDDVIIGSARWDRMQGGVGDDVLVGFEGQDWMRGGSGADRVFGGLGADDLHGGNDRDVIDASRGDVVRGGAGIDTCNFVEVLGSVRSCEEQRAVASEPVALPPAPVRATPPPAEFAWEVFTGTTWEGSVAGLLPVDVDGPDEGDCFLIVGELTATIVANGTMPSNSEIPNFGLIARFDDHDASDGCDTSTAEAAGYTDRRDLEVSQGETVRFFVPILLPPGPGEITTVVLTDQGDPIFGFIPVFLDRIP